MEDNVPELKERFNYEDFIDKYKVIIAVFLLGTVFIGAGFFYYNNDFLKTDKLELLESATGADSSANIIVVEVSGCVEKPGVFKLDNGSRIVDALALAGGLSAEADREWVEKTVNRAAKLSDGQKIYIPSKNQQALGGSANNVGGGIDTFNTPQSSQVSLVNINTSSLSELDSLPGIGPVYGQSIIDHRPYSNVEELLSKGAIKQGVYEKIRELVTVY